MKHPRKIIRIILYSVCILVLFFLIACRAGMIREMDTLHEAYRGGIDKKDIVISKNFEKAMPVTVAVLPFENLSREPEAADIMRKLFYNNFSSLPYEDIEPATVDQLLTGFSTNNIFNTIEPKKIADTLKADAVITGKITKFESFYAGVYSSISVGAEIKMFDKESGEVIWSLTHTETSRSGTVPTSIVGAILATATTALDLTKYNFIATANHFCQLAVDTIPSPKKRKGKTLPRITAMAHDGMKKVLKKGDRLQIGIEGSPGLGADFVILPGKTPYHMEEKIPGSYIGSYVVREGDVIKDGVIVVKLYDTWGNTATWEDTLGFVNIDGSPPPSVTGLKMMPGDQVVRMKWNPCEVKDILKYHVWKSETPLSGYSEIHQTEFTRFEDTAVENYRPYFYRITISDKAGNMSPPMPGISATPIPSGPTIVTGVLGGDAIWIPGANPYILQGDVTVPKDIELTIEPGVVVKGTPGSSLTIHGLLVANGDSDLPVLFEPFTENELWDGIRMNRSSERTRVTNFVVSGARYGIRIIDASPEITNGTVMNCVTGIYIKGSNAFPRLGDLTIYQNKENGIEIQDMAQSSISRCRIAYNTEAGIKIERSQASILLNEIGFNRDGITLTRSAPTIKGNVFLNNQRSALIAADVSKETLDMGLNYFGDPDRVQVFSSEAGEAGGVIRVMAEKGEENAPQDVAILPYPDELPESFERIFIITYSDEAASDTPSGKAADMISAEDSDEPVSSSLNAYIEAVSAIREKNYLKAIPLLERAKNEPSRTSSANFWLGVCYLETGDVETAIGHYRTATSLEPENVNYLLHFGVALHIAGRKIDAEKIYKEVLRREPGNTQAKKFMAVLMETPTHQKEVE